MLMRIVQWILKTPLWFAVPSVVVAGAIGAAVSAYEPLVFDPSLYEPQTADAAELTTIDAAEIEAQNASATPADVSQEAPARAFSEAGGLADGEWTGFAACGKGNPDGWKPYYVGVVVQVSEGKSKGITRIFGSSTGNDGDASLDWDASENQKYLDWARSGHDGEQGVKSQIDAMAASGSLSNVDTVSKATYSSAAIYNAYVDALRKAAKAGGASAPTTKPIDAAEQAKKKEKEKEEKKSLEAEKDVGALADGDWDGYAPCGIGNDEDWSPYYVKVGITVKDGAVASLNSIEGSSTGEVSDGALAYDETENGAYLNWAISGRKRGGVQYEGIRSQLESAINKGESPTSVDAVSGATYSSEAIFNAYYAALSKSAAAAGSTVEVPPAPVNADTATDANEPSGSSEAGGPASSAESETVQIPSSGSNDEGALKDGTYKGHAYCEDGDDPSAWSPYYIVVTITVKDGKVASIDDVYGDEEGEVDPNFKYNASQNFVYLNLATEGTSSRNPGMKSRIQAKLDAGGELTYSRRYDTVSSATWSSETIMKAFIDAVENAKNAAKQHDAGASGEGEDAKSAVDDDADANAGGDAHEDAAATVDAKGESSGKDEDPAEGTPGPVEGA